MPSTWLLLAIGMLLSIHVAVLVYAARRRWSTAPHTDNAHGYRGADAEATGSVSAELDDETVTCPECGEQNSREFRYCRRCVSELLMGFSFVRQTDGGRSRRTR